ncbi:MAG: DUF5615 family PIN-like protein [Acidobacteria bacterium]|nr:DUF5615 family PIN-like protein [Acidobacteriota bacterium]MCI0719099.1 DUF5615 family PIN-like protein [Acidobacteriota bacterium]
MKVKVDENLPIEVVHALHSQGHEADGVYDEGLAGSADSFVLERARAESRILLTLDKGVGKVVAYPPDQYPGIVLFRPPRSGRGAVLAFFVRHLPALLSLGLAKRLTVVSETGIRQR